MPHMVFAVTKLRIYYFWSAVGDGNHEAVVYLRTTWLTYVTFWTGYRVRSIFSSHNLTTNLVQTDKEYLYNCLCNRPTILKVPRNFFDHAKYLKQNNEPLMVKGAILAFKPAVSIHCTVSVERWPHVWFVRIKRGWMYNVRPRTEHPCDRSFSLQWDLPCSAS